MGKPIVYKTSADNWRRRARSHGSSYTAEYRAWCNMKTRCTNSKSKDYRHYGARGITVCERWLSSFVNFLADVGQKPGRGYTLERINNSRGYEPGNVRWATRKEQGLNQRSNHLLTFDGLTLTLAEWAQCLGVHRTTIYSRLRAGWSVTDALSPSPGRGRNKR
jgi:hypothetical protein